MEASNQRFHHIRNPLRGFRIGEARRSYGCRFVNRAGFSCVRFP